jgi:ABC-2 type transport system permease protein
MNSGDIPQSTSPSPKMGLLIDAFMNLNLGFYFVIFLFYFLFGYLLYSSMFAAIGSAVDSESDTQQFMLPVTIPLVISFAMSFSILSSDPNGNLATFMSIFPLTSPIIMMVRIPFDPPTWQIALSMVILVITFIGSTWMAGRIYRTGILMYGKKVSFAELGKWFMYKE